MFDNYQEENIKSPEQAQLDYGEDQNNLRYNQDDNSITSPVGLWRRPK